jgi:putative sigma-54 modulation protein
MNRQNHPQELIVSGIHLDLSPALKTFVQEKTERLFRHEERIIRIRMELECDPKQAVAKRFTAKGHIEIHGPDFNASVSTDECHKAVAMLVDKLDRMLERRARMLKARRHQVRAADLEAAISDTM